MAKKVLGPATIGAARPQGEVVPFHRHEPPLSYADGPHWFAIYTNIRCERRAKGGLDELGFRVFMPECTRWVSHARTRQIVKRPLLVRYLFVEVDANRRGFGEIRTADGVEAIVGSAGCPMVIPRGLVEELLTRQLKGDFDYAKDEPLMPGAKVKIVAGEWDNLIGHVTGASARRGGELLIKLLGKRHAVQIARYAVRPAMPVDE